MTLAPGSLFAGRWRVGSEVGRGGFSIVYAAESTDTGTRAALKVLVPPPAAEAMVFARLEREISALRRIEHPSVARVVDLLEDSGRRALVMELAEDGDLHQRVTREGPLNPVEARRIGSAIAGALGAAHRMGVLHRDVKPQNVLFRAGGDPLLTDFGSARVEGLATLTQTGAWVGTIDFSAPEVVAGRRADPRSDLFSLGATIYFALTGRVPRFSRESRSTPLSPGEVDSSIPQDLDAAVRRATSPDPEERFRTASEMRRALEPGALSGRSRRAGACRLCGATGTPPALPTCFDCLGSGSGRKRWVFLETFEADPSSPTREVLEGHLSGGDVEDLLAGHRPLAVLSESSAEIVCHHLARRGTRTRTIEGVRLWRQFPRPLLVAVAAAASAGILAATRFGEGALALTLAVEIVVLSAAAWRLRHAPGAIPSRTAFLPRNSRERVAAAAWAVDSAFARGLLLDHAYALGSLTASIETPGPAESIDEALGASARAAGSLARLEDLLDRLDERRPVSGSLFDSWLDAQSRCESVRDALVERLLRCQADTAALEADVAAIGREARLREIHESLRGEVALLLRVEAEIAEAERGALSA